MDLQSQLQGEISKNKQLLEELMINRQEKESIRQQILDLSNRISSLQEENSKLKENM